MENANIMHAHGVRACVFVSAHRRNGVKKIKSIVNLSPLQQKDRIFFHAWHKSRKWQKTANEIVPNRFGMKFDTKLKMANKITTNAHIIGASHLNLCP